MITAKDKLIRITKFIDNNFDKLDDDIIDKLKEVIGFDLDINEVITNFKISDIRDWKFDNSMNENSIEDIEKLLNDGDSKLAILDKNNNIICSTRDFNYSLK